MSRPHASGLIGSELLLSHVRSSTRCSTPGTAADRIASLVTLAQFQDLLASGAVPAHLTRLILRGNYLLPAVYQDAGGHLNGTAVRQLLAQGVTATVDRIDKFVPAIRAFADEIAAILDLPVNVNSYLTGGGAHALNPHYDGNDILVVQIAGSKHWRCYGPAPIGVPTGELVNVDGRAPEWEGVLAAGDVLYLPRGEVHCAMPVAPPSLHLTVRIRVSPDG